MFYALLSQLLLIQMLLSSRLPSSPLSSIARLREEASLRSRSGRCEGSAAATTHDTPARYRLTGRCHPPPCLQSAGGAGRDSPTPTRAFCDPAPGPRAPLFVVNETRLVVANRRAKRRVG